MLLEMKKRVRGIGRSAKRMEPVTSRGAEAAVGDLEDTNFLEKAFAGETPAIPRRRTFYGMDEIGYRDPGGTVVVFAKRG